MRQAIGNAGSKSSPRFKPYSAYKESGVEWLGKIPEHWAACRLKYTADDPIKNGVGEAGAYDNPDWPRYVRITDIVGPRTLRSDTFKSLPTALAKEAPFKVGDLLLAAVGATFGKSYLHSKDIGEACFAGYLVRFSPGSHVDPGFVAYWTESAAYWALVQSRVVQATIQNFSAARYRDLGLPLPGLTEQRTITTFLDRETAKIDALVLKKERLIDLLQEKRTALITRAVTKGLDPSVPMKDSGVEWLGEIPAHWPMTKMWDVTWAISGATPPKGDLRYWDGGIAWVTAKDMKRRFIDSSEDTVSEAAVAAGLKLISAPAVLVVVRGMILAHTFPVALTTVPVTINQDMKAIRLREDLKPLFFAYWLQGVSRDLLAVLVEEAAHGTKAIRMDRWRVTPVQIPAGSEQDSIVAFLDSETARIDALAAKVRDAIDALKELRTSLVSAAVTGKIDVRHATA